MSKQSFTAWYIVCFMLVFICQNDLAASTLEKQRALYLKTEQALKQGQRNRFLQFQNSLRNYPLYPYLLYTDMRKRFAYLQPETIDDFLSRYDNTPIADKLRYKWLQYLAAKNNKPLFERYYRNNNHYLNNELMCFYAQSLLHAI